MCPQALSRAALCALLLVALLPASRSEAADDSIVRVLPGTPPASPSRFGPEFRYSFSVPARWPGNLIQWKYSHVGAPAQFPDSTTVADAIVAASSKWQAVCGIRFAFLGETTTDVPNRTSGTPPQPDRVNVVGWGELNPGFLGITYSWRSGAAIVDADVILSGALVTSYAQMDRTASHEWGHAIGIGHSNLSDSLMSGTPESPYSAVFYPQLDDIRACRCLYGAASGQQAAYVCSLPTRVDFGTQSVGVESPPQRVTVTNDPTATVPLTVNGTSIASGEFLTRASTCSTDIVLQPGASCTIDFVARPATTGARSAEAVISTSDGPYRQPLAANGIVAPLSFNFQGIWWNAPANSESGWGLNLAHQGDTIFASWFTYDTSGRGWWLVMTAPKTGPNAYSGTLYQTHGPSFSTQPFDPHAVTPTAVGTGTLTFADADNGTFRYALTNPAVTQTKSITRQVFGPLPTCAWGSQPNLALATNYQDLWWAAPAGSESGWGINLNHEGDTIFATWFTYDPNGTPMWLVATAPKSGPATYVGELSRTSGPRFDAYDPAKVVSVKVGTAAFAFSDGNSATFTYTVQLAGMASPVTQTKAITRQVFNAPGTACQ